MCLNSTCELEPPWNLIRLYRPSPSGSDHDPEQNLAFIREAATTIADCYVSLEIPTEHRRILVANSVSQR